jgi:small subunit ribosomal protein S16
MAVALRLARAGTHKRPFYWIVAAHTHKPRDGRYLEKVGTYDPTAKPTSVTMKLDRITFWLDRGAKPSDAVREILRGQGVLKDRATAKAGKSAGTEATPAT